MRAGREQRQTHAAHRPRQPKPCAHQGRARVNRPQVLLLASARTIAGANSASASANRPQVLLLASARTIAGANSALASEQRGPTGGRWDR